jgi:hypothetical protein
VPGWPGAPSGALFVVCGGATLNGLQRLELESAGPRATTSRIFNENHPDRQGGFLADNLLRVTGSAPVTGEGLLFRSEGRYDPRHPPKSDDGPAPGPGKVGGFEVNVFWDEAAREHVLVRFDATLQRADLTSRGVLSIGVSSANASECELKKEMLDIALVVGHQVLASGSIATVSGFPGLPENARLAVAGNLQLDETVARGGPRSYNLVPLGPLQNYSPLYYHSYNGFWFFNNIVHDAEPRIDTSGLVFSGAGNSFELSLYFQNEVGITCDGSVTPPKCREVKDGSGYAMWVYDSSKDRLHEKTFGNLAVTPRRTCATAPSRPLQLPVAPLPVSEAFSEPAAVGWTGNATAIATALVAVALTTALLLWSGRCGSSSSQSVA